MSTRSKQCGDHCPRDELIDKQLSMTVQKLPVPSKTLILKNYISQPESAKCLHCCFLLLLLWGVRKGDICTSILVAVLGELFGLPASLPASLFLLPL